MYPNIPDTTLNLKASKRSRNTWKQNYDFLFFILDLLRHFPADVSNSTLVARTFYNDHSPFYDTSRSFNALEHSIRGALRSLHQLGLISISFKKIYVRSITINPSSKAIPVLQRYFQNTPNQKIPTMVKDMLKSESIGKSEHSITDHPQYGDFQELLNLPGERKLSQPQQKQAFSYFLDAIRKFNCSADTIIASRALYTHHCALYNVHPRSIFNWLKNLTFDAISLMHNTFLTLEPMLLNHQKAYQGKDGFENKVLDNMITSEASEHIDEVYRNLKGLESADQLPSEFKNWRCLLYLISHSTQKIKQKILDIFVSSATFFHKVHEAFVSVSKTYQSFYA